MLIRDECIPWKPYRLKRYGRASVCCRNSNSKTTKLAHIIAYEKVNGTVPDGKIIHHICGNPGCVNPSHLLAVTPAEHAGIHKSWPKLPRGFKKKMSHQIDLPKESQENIVISFAVKVEMYDKLKERLPGYGERSEFFRTVLEQFLDGRLVIAKEKKF